MVGVKEERPDPPPATGEIIRIIERILQPMRDNVTHLNDRQNVMERQAERIVIELKQVVHSLTTQQASLEDTSRKRGARCKTGPAG